MRVPEPLPQVVIDDATNADRAWAADLMASSDPWRRLGRDLATSAAVVAAAPDTELFVARGPAGPLGFVLLRRRGFAGSPYIVSIGVDPAARGGGIGALLLAFVERHVTPPARHLFLCVSSFNTEAQRFYDRLGFQRVGELPDYVIDGASEIILHKRLAP